MFSREAQLTLTLRAVVGLTTEEIARAFVVHDDAVAKRIVRAKHKIVLSKVPYQVPGPDELASRLDEVLTVIYLVFNEGYVATAGEVPIRRDLARDAEWLASLLARLLPDEPEPLGLVALIRLHLARWPARLDAAGRLVLLEKTSSQRRPRLHDLRHTFAVNTIINWYRNGLGAYDRLYLLSTYLGHVDPKETYWYLSGIPELLELAGARLEQTLGDLP